MKRIVMILLCGTMFYSASFAQRITMDKVPVLVSRAFNSKFPAATQQSWERETLAVYEVNFYNGGKKQSASYDTSGTWRETETAIKFDQLPHPVNAAFNKQFAGFRIQETLQVETADKGTLYELTINKGKEGYEVLFSAKGEIVKKEAAGEDEK